MLFLKYFLALLAIAGFVSWATTASNVFLAPTIGAVFLLLVLALGDKKR
jgi:hypothetical protein